VLSGNPEGLKTKTGCPIENFGHDRHVEMIFHSIMRILIRVTYVIFPQRPDSLGHNGNNQYGICRRTPADIMLISAGRAMPSIT
jgi:hypothetical protein